MSHCFICPKLMFNLSEIVTSKPTDMPELNNKSLLLWLDTILIIVQVLGVIPIPISAVIASIIKC